MTELDFIETSPIDYGGGNNVNLLISSSVTNPGVDNTPLAPFTLYGMTIPLQDENGLNIASALKEVEEIKFTFTEGTISTKILTRTRRNNYFYVRLEPKVFNTLPPVIDTLGVGTPAEQDIFRYDGSEFIFTPYFQISFANNDFNPLMNTSNTSKANAVAMVVDRTSDAANPTNLTAILAGTAQPAQIQNCSYTKAGLIHARYEGTKLTSGSFEGNDPALTFREFDASLHATKADNTTIKAIDDNKRDVVTLYFTPEITGSHPNKFLQNFPQSSSIVYEEVDNRFIRISEQKVYIVEEDTVLTMNDIGRVSLVE